MSGTEMQREKERVAKMMREKQAAGTSEFEQAVERQLLTHIQPTQRRPLRAA
jgi:hypothetical protein